MTVVDLIDLEWSSNGASDWSKNAKKARDASTLKGSKSLEDIVVHIIKTNWLKSNY